MKNRVFYIFIICTFLLAGFGWSFPQHHGIQTKADKTQIENLDFNKEPVKFMGVIYKCYHNWNIDQGIKLSKQAIAIVNKLYDGNPQATLDDPSLKLNKVFQIKSTLHTLNGMLLHRKSLEAVRKSGLKENEFILKKLKKGEKVTDSDLEKLSKKIESKDNTGSKSNLLTRSRDEFLMAIKVDPTNPSAHFQLAGVLAATGDRESSKSAEKHYFEAARLGAAEGDKKAVKRTLEKLNQLNPNSPYINKIKSLNVSGAGG